MRIAQAKRCPFCRSINGFVERMELSSWQYVCNDCFAHGPEVTYSGDNDDHAKAAATRAWNRRDRVKREAGLAALATPQAPAQTLQHHTGDGE